MGRIDTNTKEYVRRPEVFADLFNYLIYDGRHVITPDSLSELDTTENYTPFDRKGKIYPVQKYRDVLKRTVIMTNEKIAYALILGVENQTDTHYAMPVRNMGYDAYHYAAQVDAIIRENKKNKSSDPEIDFLSGLKKDDKIIPVLTLVLHFGQEPWDGSMRLHEMFEIQEPEILKFIPDYKINLISPISMTMAEIEKFTTDFKQLAALIQCSRDKNALQNLIEKDEKFKHMDPLTANIANDVIHSKLKFSVNRKGEIDMCVAVAEMRRESRMEGFKEAEAKARTAAEEIRRESRMEGFKEAEAKAKIAAEEIRRESRMEGREEGKTDILNQLVAKGILSPEQAAQF